jgi:hypothetical protein
MESVDHAPRDEECLAKVQVGARSADRKRGDAVQPEDGLIEVVVAVVARLEPRRDPRLLDSVEQ